MFITQGSILALWSTSDPPIPGGFREKVQVVRDGGKDLAASPRTWRGPVNILSWNHLEKILGKDHRFEFRHCGRNVCITSADLSCLNEGDHIWVGNVNLIATRKGFECPKRCHLDPREPIPCVLAENWIFAEVVEEGPIQIDNSLFVTRD